MLRFTKGEFIDTKNLTQVLVIIRQKLFPTLDKRIGREIQLNFLLQRTVWESAATRRENIITIHTGKMNCQKSNKNIDFSLVVVHMLYHETCSYHSNNLQDRKSPSLQSETPIPALKKV